ncbi:MAG TPA: carboxypeptidase regulatory-like domain-containing protein, partial [Planctomycetota bacterium]
ADELGVPLATVKSRLARGLEKLRLKLGAEFRGDEPARRRGLAALAGLGSPALVTGGAAAAGSLAVAPWLALAAATVVLGAGVLAWWQASSSPPEEHVASTAAHAASGRASGREAGGAQAAELPDGTDTERVVDGARREAAAPTAAAPDVLEAFPPEAAFPFRIAGRVRDAHDLPLEGVSVYLAPRLFPFNHAATTDAEGRFTVAFDGRRAQLPLTLAFVRRGHATLLREVELLSGRELAVDVGLPSASRVLVRGNAIEVRSLGDAGPLRFRFEDEPVVEEASLELTESRTHLEQVAAVLAARLHGPGNGGLDSAPEMLVRPDGRSLFVDPPPPQACERARWARGALIDRLREDRLRLEEVRVRELVLSAAVALHEEPERKASVRGVVRDAAGRPVAGALVAWGIPDQFPAGRATTDASGTFVLEGLGPGELALQAGGGDHGRATTRVTLAAGDELAWNPVLERGAELGGRLVLPGGAPHAGARVELWRTDSATLWCDATRTGDDGRFALPNLPPGAFELHVTPAGQRLPTRVLGPLFAGTDVGTLELTPEELAMRDVHLRLIDATDQPLQEAELRLRQLATGLVALTSAPDEAGTFLVPDLPAGAYRVELGSARAWRDLGTVWIDPAGHGPLDLGRERVADPGELRIAETGAGAAPTLVLWSAHPDVFGRVTGLEPEGPRVLTLRPGEYVLCAERRGGARCEAPLAVGGGEASELTLERTEEQLVARPGIEPAFEAAARTRCDACHATGVHTAPEEVWQELRGTLVESAF